MSNKRIVLVGPAFPYRGGQALVEAHLYNALTTIGYDVYTVTFTMLYPKMFFPGQTQMDTSEKTFYSHSNKIFRIINSVNPITWFKAFNKIKSINPALTLFVWWMPFFGPCYSTIAWLSKKFTSSKIGFLVENYISHENRWFDKVLCKISLGLADDFICQSNFIKNNLLKNHPNTPVHKTTLSVYDCYNFNAYNRETAKQYFKINTPNVVLFFGLIRKYKGLDKLIEAFSVLKNKENTTLLIAGECYEDANYYKEIIEKNNLQKQTIFIDKFIANEDIEPYFKAANVVCLPYNSASQSGILMMAYGFKVPVVVNNVGGLGELVMEGKTGYITENNSQHVLASAIEKVLNDNSTNFEINIDNLNQSLGYKNIDNIIAEIIK